MLQLTERRVRLSLRLTFGHCAIRRIEEADQLATYALSRAVAERAWITDPVTSVKRLHNPTAERSGHPEHA